MIPAHPTLPGCSRRLRRTVTPTIARAARIAGADRYRKHFPATAQLWLLLVHGLSASPSLRQSYSILLAMPGVFGRLGLSSGLSFSSFSSFSQLARSTTSRPSACFEALLADLCAQARRTVIPDASWRALRKVQLIDRPFLRLSAQFSPWSQTGGFTPGIRVQTGFELARHLPTRLVLTLTDTNDHESLNVWDLEPLRGWTVIVDLGYDGHRQFARLQDGGVSFLSRLHP